MFGLFVCRYVAKKCIYMSVILVTSYLLYQVISLRVKISKSLNNEKRHSSYVSHVFVCIIYMFTEVKLQGTVLPNLNV